MIKILAAASSGGHWIQLMRVSPAFAGNNVLYVSTAEDLAQQISDKGFVFVPDGNFEKKMTLLIMAVRVFFCVAKYRPDVVISTGAAVGFFSLLFGKLFGAKTIWIDSIANAEEMSLAGKKVRSFSDYWLTQWPELAREDGPQYIGSVL